MTRADLNDLRIEPLDREGFFVLVDWAKQEGWNPGIHDAEAFWAQDPEGFLGVHEGNELIAGGSIVSYEGTFGFMGFFIVKPAFRGHGLGRRLWIHRRDALLQRLQPGAAIGMDGVVDMQPFYARGGFKKQFADVRFRLSGEKAEAHPNVVRGVGQEDELLAFDKSCFLFDRPRFLASWWSQPGGAVFRYVENKATVGYATLRLATEGHRIGPLFANHPEAARALVQACLSEVPGGNVNLDIPMGNPHAVALVESLGGEAVFECARMVHGRVPQWPLERIYGITSFELG